MFLNELLGDQLIAPGGFHTVWNHRLIGDQKECTCRNLVGESSYEERSRLHVDPHAPHGTQFVLEILIVFPNPSICSINGTRPVVLVILSNRGRNSSLKTECWKRRDFGR